MRNRKGFTLAELTVAMALVAVISAVVVSFAVMMGERTRANQEKLNVIQELDLVESSVESWVDAVGGSVAEFNVGDNNKELSATVGGIKCYIGFDDEDGLLTISRPDVSDGSITLVAINNILFEVKQSGEKSLILCRAYYYDNNQLTVQTFTVFSRVGQTVGD